ncbi:hypothetical protein CIK90_08545 [Prevotella sp. P5-126]|nr:hypothetical protein CIK90_08470 [Prevotella sp. P5-126]OYP37363.1 hypothetical protein CIK90_08545 [Prevotella sp. P5-126]
MTRIFYPRSTRRARIFWVARAQEILEEILFKMLLRKKYCGFAVYLQIKSLTKIFDQNAQQYVALQEGLLGDRIGDARNLNENLKKNL